MSKQKQLSSITGRDGTLAPFIKLQPLAQSTQSTRTRNQSGPLGVMKKALTQSRDFSCSAANLTRNVTFDQLAKTANMGSAVLLNSINKDRMFNSVEKIKKYSMAALMTGDKKSATINTDEKIKGYTVADNST